MGDIKRALEGIRDTKINVRLIVQGMYDVPQGYVCELAEYADGRVECLISNGGCNFIIDDINKITKVWSIPDVKYIYIKHGASESTNVEVINEQTELSICENTLLTARAAKTFVRVVLKGVKYELIGLVQIEHTSDGSPAFRVQQGESNIHSGVITNLSDVTLIANVLTKKILYKMKKGAKKAKRVSFDTVKTLAKWDVIDESNAWRTWWLSDESEAPVFLQPTFKQPGRIILWSAQKPYKAFYHISQEEAEKLI